MTTLRITKDNYYTAPSQEVFDEIKRAAMQLWGAYENTYGYATEKIDRIKDIKNVEDNYAYIVAMFDSHNQRELTYLLENDEALDLVEALLYRNDTAS